MSLVFGPPNKSGEGTLHGQHFDHLRLLRLRLRLRDTLYRLDLDEVVATTGVDPLRGQNNVQGACDIGALPNVFPSYQSVSNVDHREKFEKAWGVELSAEPGLTLMDMTHSGKDGPVFTWEELYKLNVMELNL